MADVFAAHSDESGKPAGHPEKGLKVATIAAESGLSERHVHRCKSQLECAGVLGIERRPAAGQPVWPNRYHLTVRRWSLGAVLLREWARRIADKREASYRRRLAQDLDGPGPRRSGSFTCPEPGCGWRGAVGPCPIGHDPPGEVSAAGT